MYLWVGGVDEYTYNGHDNLAENYINVNPMELSKDFLLMHQTLNAVVAHG